MPREALLLPADALDAELIDENVAIVAGIGGVTLVDVALGRSLGTFEPPSDDMQDVQTLAFGSTTRIGAVAWRRENRVTHLVAYPQDGEAIALALPEEGDCRGPLRMSSYRGEELATSHSFCDELFAFNPSNGIREMDTDLPQTIAMDAFHTLPDGTSAGANSVIVRLWTPGEERRSMTALCSAREAAPDPSNVDAIFVRCEDQLMRYDFAEEALSTLIGGSVEELNLDVLSLGVSGER
ncbi:MAG: hypothetical protein AB8H86_29835 [Polyangiales bacterium]